MPERAKAEDKLVRDLLGGLAFYMDECKTIPHNDYLAVKDLAREIYGRIITRLDWPRILLEASSRHLALDHPKDEYHGYLCAECLEKALMTYDRNISGDQWEFDQNAPEPQAYPRGFKMPEPVRVLIVLYAHARNRLLRQIKEGEGTFNSL